jgi:hypothetical protein
MQIRQVLEWVAYGTDNGSLTMCARAHPAERSNATTAATQEASMLFRLAVVLTVALAVLAPVVFA